MADHTSPAPLDRRPGHRNKNVQQAAVLLLAGVNPDFLVALVEVLLAITVGVALAVRTIGWLVIVAQALGWIFAVQTLVYLVSTLAWLITTHLGNLSGPGGFVVVMQTVLLGCAITIPWILRRHR
jgi:hypothetical protein